MKTLMKKLLVLCSYLLVAGYQTLALAQAPAASASPPMTDMVVKDWITMGGSDLASWTAFLAASPDNTLYLSYREEDNAKAIVKKLNGTDWVTVGTSDYTHVKFNGSPMITVAPDGTPYVALQNTENSFKAIVMKLDGSKWVNVGQPNFSAGGAFNLKLAFAPNGDLYAAYLDDSQTNGNIAVMKFHDGKWADTGLSVPYYGVFVDLVISPSGVPYVSYAAQRTPNPNTAGVLKLVAGNWVPLGQFDFLSGNHGNGPVIAVASDETPYMVYPNYTNNGKATAMKFDGTKWIPAGQPGFSPGAVDALNLRFAPNDVLYVSYRDLANHNKIAVSKLSRGTPTNLEPSDRRTNALTETWTSVGQPDFSAAAVEAPSLAIVNEAPCVAYTEPTDQPGPYPLIVKCYRAR